MTANEIIAAINEPMTANAAADWQRLQDLSDHLTSESVRLRETTLAYLGRKMHLAWFARARLVAARFETIVTEGSGRRGGKNYIAAWTWKNEYVHGSWHCRSRKAAREALAFTLKFD